MKKNFPEVGWQFYVGAGCLVGLVVYMSIFGNPLKKPEMKTELGIATQKAPEVLQETKEQKWLKATPFNMIDAKTMEVVSYPAVSEGKSATIFLFWWVGNSDCREQVQVLNYIHEKYGNVKVIGIPVIALHLLEKRASIVVGKHKKNSPANFTEVIDLSDSQSEMSKLVIAYDLIDFPTTIIVDAEGNVRHKLEGSHSSDKIEEFLKELGVAQQEETG